jgi:hypothetical protein
MDMVKKKEKNKKYFLDKFKEYYNDGVDYPGVGLVKPSKLTLKNGRKMLSLCEDRELEGWDVALYANSSLLFSYTKRRGEVNACVNVAEAGVSGVFAFRNIYETIETGTDDIEKIIEIFKLVKDNVG